jgi:hypothetical protein
LPSLSTVVFVGLVFVFLILFIVQVALIAHGDAVKDAGGFLDRRAKSHVDTAVQHDHAGLHLKIGVESLRELKSPGISVKHLIFQGLLER